MLIKDTIHLVSRTLIYFMSALSVMYALMAHFTAHSGSKDAKRVLATFTSASLSVWAISYAVSFASTNAQESLFWRKLGVFGWGTVHSFVLHFVILVTKSLQQKKHRALLVLVYAPAILNLVFFLFWPAFADQQYHMVFQNGLWINKWVDTSFNWGYVAYGLLSILLSMGMLISWYLRSNLVVEKKQAIAIFMSLLVVVIITLVANQLLHQVFDTQLTTILIVITALFPALTVSYHVRRHSLFFAAAELPDQLQPKILSAKVRTQIYRVGGLALFLFSFFVFYSVTINSNLSMPQSSRLAMVAAGLLFMVFSQVLCSLKNSRLTIRQQELVFFIIFVVFDILLFLRYASSGGVTVWAAILLLIIASTIFDNIWMVTLGTGIHVLLMVYMAFRHPFIITEVSMVDHGWRILIVGAAMGLAYAVNRIYRKRLLDNIEFAKLQASVSQVALLMARGEQAGYQRILGEVMEVANQFLAPDSILLLSVPRAGDNDQTSQSIANHLPVPMREIDISPILQVLTEYDDNTMLDEFCILTSNLPEYSSPLRDTLHENGIDKLMLTPLKTGYGSFCLVLAIHQQVRAEDQHWRNHMYVSMLSSFLTNYIQRTGSERALEQLAFTDHLTGLFKRDRFMDLADQQLQLPNPEGLVNGLLFIDLNGFKRINDQAGHQAGDLALKKVAEKIGNTCLPVDLIGRFGGDEFLVFARRKTETELSDLENKINHALVFNYQYAGLAFPISAAIGSAIMGNQTNSIWQMLEMADRAMYIKKTFCTNSKLEPR